MIRTGNTLAERVRPRTLDQVVAQPKAVAQCRRLIESGIGGRAVYISGPSGAGKTTLALILARSIAADSDIVEFASGRLLTVADLREWSETSAYRGWGEKGGRVLIVNEIHHTRADVFDAMIGLLEPIPPHVAYIFTTTKAGDEKLFEDSIEEIPFRRRAACVSLTNQGVQRPAAEYVRTVAQAHGLDGQPIERYERLAKDCKGSIGLMLSRVDAGEMIV